METTAADGVVAARPRADEGLSAWSDALLVGAALAYAAFIGVLTLARGQLPSADVLLVAAGFGAAMGLRGRVAVLRDWMPFLVLFLAYELMRGLADDVGLPVHAADIVALERGLFGGALPTAVLQGWLHPATGVDPLAVVGTLVYLLHFPLPLATAILLWRRRPELFHPYLVALILLSFAGFATYLLLPVAPPWMAVELGVLGAAPADGGVAYLKPDAFAWLAQSIGIDGARLYDVVFRSINANPVAAFPSLHAAYPFLTFLVLRRAFGRIGWLALGYFALVAFTIVYTADHYVVDVLAGAAYASGAYGLMWWLARRRGAAVRGGLRS
ncbi:MAG: phosphatase PAP2 family protein [Candidatus Limnocylindria bacterium]